MNLYLESLPQADAIYRRYNAVELSDSQSEQTASEEEVPAENHSKIGENWWRRTFDLIIFFRTISFLLYTFLLGIMYFFKIFCDAI